MSLLILVPGRPVIGTKSGCGLAVIAVELFVKGKPNDRHWYAYDVVLGGQAIVSDSRDPEHDLARALRHRGIKGVIEIRDGKTGKPRSRVNIEAAAKQGTSSNLDRYHWKPHEIGKDSPPAGKTEVLVVQGGVPA